MGRSRCVVLVVAIFLSRPIQVYAGDPEPDLKDPECGCQSMLVNTQGAGSGFPDPRRKDHDAVLGRDPSFPALGFEVEATLVPGSVPSKCEEGQDVKNTVSVNGGVVHYKALCTGGQVGKSCEILDSGPAPICDTYTCQGGTEDGNDCTTKTAFKACMDGGGQACTRNGDGFCTVYPFGNAVRGADDYRETSDTKKHLDDTILWFDAPGLARSADVLPNEHYFESLDFFAFVKGKLGFCSCHFQVTIDATVANHVLTYGAATGATLVGDAETTINCHLR